MATEEDPARTTAKGQKSLEEKGYPSVSSGKLERAF